MTNQEIILKLKELQATLTRVKWVNGVQPHDDFFTNYVIEDTTKRFGFYPDCDIIEYIYREIDNSFNSSDQTSYYLEYAEGYRRVYDYLKK